jgi:PAS domain-containing protein
LSWLIKHGQRQPVSEEEPSEGICISSFFVVFLLTGLGFSILILLYRNIFRTDLSNPVAETATILMFASAFFFVLKNKRNMAVNMVFFIPLLVYLHYLAGFSNTAPPSDTIYYLLYWYLSGLTMMTLTIPFGWRYVLFFFLGLISLWNHARQAELTAHYFSSGQIIFFNPFLILSFLFTILILLRIKLDKRYKQFRDQKAAGEQMINDSFQRAGQPLAVVKVIRDQDKNVIRLEIEKINRAFESCFRMSFTEARNQEVNLFFGYIFRNDINWNDLFIIDPKQQTVIYSNVLGKWFTLQMLWLGFQRCYCLFNDVTAEYTEKQHLEDTKAKYLALLEAIPDIFFVIDRDGTFQDMVFKGQENLLPETSEIIGNSIFTIGFSKMMADKIYQCIQKAIENDTVETIEYSMDAKGAILFLKCVWHVSVIRL